jgi:DNA-binding NarL/FixJ family response regulator
MSEDLISLRILSCVGGAKDSYFFQQAANSASIPIHIKTAESITAARNALATSEIDVALLDAAAAPADLTSFIASARSAQPRPFVVLIAVDAVQASSFKAGSVVPDAVIVKPDSVETAKAIVDRCIRLRRPTSVLIVDDSAALRGIVRRVLVATRFVLDIKESENGIDALKQIGEGSFNMVFLDDLMPELGGLETLIAIKHRYPKIHVVLMMSTNDENFRERAQAAGAAAFLKKPFYPADVDAVLRSYFGLRVPGR